MNLEAREKNAFVDRVFRTLDTVEYRCARSARDRNAIFRLRYQSYLREGAIGPNETGMFSDRYDDAPNVWIVGMYIEGDLAGSIRFHLAEDLVAPLPARDVFSDILAPHLEVGRSILDPTRFVASLEHSRRTPELPYLMLRAGMLAGAYFDPFYMLATVRSEHQPYYRRVFGYQTLSAPRAYPGLRKPIACMALSHADRVAPVTTRFPFFASTASERELLYGRVAPELASSKIPEFAN